MPKIEVVLGEHDVKQFQRNLIKYGVLQSFKTETGSKDLGEILRNEAIIRGGNNA